MSCGDVYWLFGGKRYRGLFCSDLIVLFDSTIFGVTALGGYGNDSREFGLINWLGLFEWLRVALEATGGE